jgi:hypothetical protein
MGAYLGEARELRIALGQILLEVGRLIPGGGLNKTQASRQGCDREQHAAVQRMLAQLSTMSRPGKHGHPGDSVVIDVTRMRPSRDWLPQNRAGGSFLRVLTNC